MSFKQRALKKPVWKRKKGLLALAILLLGGGVAIYLLQQTAMAPTHVKTTAINKVTSPKTIRFIATGDMLPHDTVNQAAKTTNGYNYLPLFSEVQRFLTSGDMAYCNQESPSDPSLPVSGYPAFNAPASFATDLNKEGCNIINLANNHANDRGQAGIDATIGVWHSLKTLAVAGTASNDQQQSQVTYFNVKGIEFAFLSYAQCSNSATSSYGLNILSKSLADPQIAEAKQKADIIIAAMHSCDENKSNEDAWQDQWAQYFADNGVDIVVGTGPHWLQPVKRLPKAGGGTTVVWFSLGNFLSSQEDINGLIGGIAVMDIDITSKSVISLSFLPTYMHYEWTAQQKAADDLLARHNLKLYPLDQAAAPLAKSQNNTTVEAQTNRVTQLLNTYTKVNMLTSQTFPR